MKVLCTRYSKKLGRGQKKRCHKRAVCKGGEGGPGRGRVGVLEANRCGDVFHCDGPPPRLSGLNYHHSD